MILYYDDQDHYQNGEGRTPTEKKYCKQLNTDNVKGYKIEISSRYVELVGDYTKWKLLALMNDGSIKTLIYFEMDCWRNGFNIDHADILEHGKTMIVWAILYKEKELVLDFSVILQELGQVDLWSDWMDMAGTDEPEPEPEPWGVIETFVHMIKDAYFMPTWRP